MAIYHLSIKLITRNKGRSAVAAAAYRAGEKLYEQATGIMHDYTRKGGVIFSEILLPGFAPYAYEDRETLWNAVQTIEKNSNAQLAREVEVALPREMSQDEHIECVRSFINDNFVDNGMCADWSLHDTGKGNPHAHIMLTMRQFKSDGTWDAKKRNTYVLDENGDKIPVIDKKTGLQKIEKKTGRKVWKRQTVEVNDWNSPDNAEAWRKSWEEHVNRYLSPEHHIDHRSYERQGIGTEPTIHEGYAARDMERKGKFSERCEENRRVRERNSIREEIKKLVHELTIFIVEKVRALYERFRNADRDFRNLKQAERDDRNHRGPAGRTGVPGEGEEHSSLTDRFIEATESAINETEQAVARLIRLKDEKEREQNERIENIRRRQRALFDGADAGQDGIHEGRNRKPESADFIPARTEVDDFLRELEAKENAAVSGRGYSFSEGENRSSFRLGDGTEEGERTFAVDFRTGKTLEAEGSEPEHTRGKTPPRRR